MKIPYANHKRRVLRLAQHITLAIALAFICGGTSEAQSPTSYILASGTPTFSTVDQLPGGVGFVNVANGNLHIEVPLGSYPQRGRRAPYTAKLVYDSRQWFASTNVSPYQWVNTNYIANAPNLSGGWSIITSEDVGEFYPFEFTSGQQPPNGICHNNTGYYTVFGADVLFYPNYIPTVWLDPGGTPHFFPIVLILDGGCGVTNILSGDAYATDGSGFHLFQSVNPSSQVLSSTIYGKDGKQYTFLDAFGTGQLKDSNGNYTQGLNNYVNQAEGYGSLPPDTLGRHPITMTVPPPSAPDIYFQPLPSAFNALNSQNLPQAITPEWQDTHFHTNFQVSGYEEADGYQFVLQKLTLPDNTAYTFTYDCDSSTGNPACSSPANQAAYYDLLTSVTLPTGATISFVNSTLTDANGNVNQWITNRSDSDSGTWTYALSTACSPNCQTVTTTKPSGDQTVFKFDLSSGSGAWNESMSVYTGAATGTALMTTTTAYNQYPVASIFGSFGYTHPTSTTVKFPGAGPSGMDLVKTTNFDYETSYSFTYSYPSSFSTPEPESTYTAISGKLKSTTENSYAGSIYRKTVFTYQNDSNSNYKTIDNLPTDIQLQDGSGNLSSEIKISYDASGLVSDVPAVVAHDPTYNGSYTYRGNPTTVQRLVASGKYLTANITYDTTGQVRTSTDWSGNLTAYSYGDNFFLDNGGSTIATPYFSASSTNAFVTYVKPPLIPASKMGYYFGTGQIAFKSDANNNTSYAHYFDPLSRPTSTQLPNGGWTYFNYPTGAKTPLDVFQAITSATPSTSCFGAGDCRDDQVQLDTLGRTAHALLISDPDGQTSIDVGYDSSGRVNSVSNPHRSASNSTDGTETYPVYDGMNRKIQVTRADGAKAYTYFGAAVGSNGGLSSQICTNFGSGYPTLQIDEAGNKHQSWTDAFGRLIEVDEPNYSTGTLSTGTCYAYDVNDNLIGVLSQGSSEATCTVNSVSYNRCFSYDSASRLLSATHPESGTTTYVNDQDTSCPTPNSFPGQLISRTDARGRRTCFQYDALNRTTQTNYSDSTTPTVQYSYDQSSFNGLTISNGVGRRTGMSDASGLTAWSYDSVGNVTVKQQKLTNVLPNVTKKFSYTYNLDGSVATVQYPSGRTLTYQTGGAQRPLSVMDSGSAITYAVGARYAPHGALTSLIYGGYGSNQPLFSLVYDSRLQPCWRYANSGTGLAWSGTSCTASASTGTALDLKYSFNLGSNDNGNVIGITNNRDNFRSQAFTYDHLNRLATAQSTSTYATSPTECWSEVYGYDAIANLLSIQPTTNSAYNGCATENLGPLAVNSHNQISSPTGYVYDSSGNLTSLTGLSSFKYDPLGRRIEKTTSSTTSIYAYDSDNLIEEVNSSGAVVARYTQTQNIDEPLAMLRSSATSYYQADGLGTVTSLTNSSGATAETYTYDSFGKLTASSGSLTNPFQYTGRESDPETGLYYYRARYYDASVGRFLSEDLLGSAAGGTDFYRYSFNSPTDLTDPFGLAPGIVDRILNWWKPTSPPPTPCAPKFNCGADGYRDATPFESSQALAAAASQTGKPYGGKGPDSFDCSGLVCWAIQQSVSSSFPNQGTGGMHNPQPSLMPINPSQAGPGNIVLFPGHVGFYDPSGGKNNLWSASSKGVGGLPIGVFNGPPTFFRLRVPCNR